MKKIGYWISDLKDEEFCAPQEIVGFLPDDVRTKVANYLAAGSVDLLRSGFGYSWCRFFCGMASEQMGSKELTDGEWLWPEGLSHYVRHHGIILPEEFIAHVLAGGSRFCARDCTSEPVAEGDSSSCNYWRNWCAAHRSPHFLERLRHARAEADARALVVERAGIQRRISEEISRYGLGEERCLFAGCGERVLKDMKLCAYHIIIRYNENLTSGCYQISPNFMA